VRIQAATLALDPGALQVTNHHMMHSSVKRGGGNAQRNYAQMNALWHQKSRKAWEKVAVKFRNGSLDAATVYPLDAGFGL
jgi:hypothetical protein